GFSLPRAHSGGRRLAVTVPSGRVLFLRGHASLASQLRARFLRGNGSPTFSQPSDVGSLLPNARPQIHAARSRRPRSAPPLRECTVTVSLLRHSRSSRELPSPYLLQLIEEVGQLGTRGHSPKRPIDQPALFSLNVSRFCPLVIRQ